MRYPQRLLKYKATERVHGLGRIRVATPDGAIKMNCPVVRDNQILTKFSLNQVFS